MENKKLKNIVLITLDCVRPDHIGYFGYKNVNTSIMDQLARKGIIFEQAFSQAPNTWVSLASIFTGCNPTKHDLHTPYDKISGKTPTMAETLSKNGYYTIGFPAHGLVGKVADFHSGFNFFYDDNLKFDSKIKDVKWGSNWKKVLEIANTEIRKNDQKPLFIWFHYMNTHHFPENSIPLPYLYRFRFSSKWQYYDGKISYADKNCIKNIVKLLKKNGIFEDTIIIIFSDHGEELENNKFPKHDNLLYDDVLRILFLISAPDIIPVNKKIKNLVRSIDIFPTLLDMLNIKIGNMDIDNWAYSENITKNIVSIRSPDSRLVVSIEIKDSSNKYEIRAKEFNLFNINQDSYGKKEKIPAELMKEVDQILSDLKKSINFKKDVKSSEETMIGESLKSLGYI